MTFLILHIIAALITFALNTYVQLVLADNWPPTNRSRIAWDAMTMLLTLSLFLWPFVLFLMWIEGMPSKYAKHIARKNNVIG